MKVGTDAVLLGAWVEIGNAKNILDVGTGCGVIALMLAQRSSPSAHIDAVEPDKNSTKQAAENFNGSPWPDKIHVHESSVQQYQHAPYDLIVTNPPFFSNSLLPPTSQRQTTRHTETLSFDELLHAAKRLVAPDGRLAVILPFTEGNRFKDAAQKIGFECHRSMAFYSRLGKPQERWVMEFSTRGKIPAKETEILALYDEGEKWTKEYTRLTEPFYLLKPF